MRSCCSTGAGAGASPHTRGKGWGEMRGHQRAGIVRPERGPGATASTGTTGTLPQSPPRLFRRRREEEPLPVEVIGAMRVPSPAALVTLVRAAAGGGVLRCRIPPGGSRIPAVRRSSGSPQAVIAAKEPFAVELKAGRTYAWCSCGHSKRQVRDGDRGRRFWGVSVRPKPRL